jgi:hypothetical protein
VDDESSGSPTKPCYLLNNTILNYSLRYPYLHISSLFHLKFLGRNFKKESPAPPVRLLPFGFKPTLILNHAIVWLDNHVSYNNSTSYSCWCSHLNQTTHIAWSLNQFPYSVTLGTQGLTISRLSTRAPFRKPQTT